MGKLKRNSKEEQKPTWFKHLINFLDTAVEDMNTADSDCHFKTSLLIIA